MVSLLCRGGGLLLNRGGLCLGRLCRGLDDDLTGEDIADKGVHVLRHLEKDRFDAHSLLFTFHSNSIFCHVVTNVIIIYYGSPARIQIFLNTWPFTDPCLPFNWLDMSESLHPIAFDALFNESYFVPVVISTTSNALVPSLP